MQNKRDMVAVGKVNFYMNGKVWDRSSVRRAGSCATADEVGRYQGLPSAMYCQGIKESAVLGKRPTTQRRVRGWLDLNLAIIYVQWCNLSGVNCVDFRN